MVELLGVPAQPGVVPERCPARRHAGILLGAGAHEVADRLQPGRPQVGPVGVGALDRVAQDHDHLGVRDQLADAALRGTVIEIKRCRLTARGTGRGAGEQRLVVRPPPDMLAVGLYVARPAAAGRRRPVGEEELGLLDRRHEQARMRGQGSMQRRGARLGGADDEEVRQGHGADLLGRAVQPAKATIPIRLVD